LAVLSTSASIATPGLPVGSIQAFAGANAPTGWLLCDGSEVGRASYPDLFNTIGTIYGAGNTTTTFNLPDLRGRVPAGKDNMGGTAAGRLTAAVSGIAGTALGTAGGSQNIPDHSHQSYLRVLEYYDDMILGGSGQSGIGGYNSRTGAWTTWQHPVTTVTASANNYTGRSTQSTWVSQTNMISEGPSYQQTPQNVQPTLVVNYIVKAVADIARGGWYTQSSPPVVTQLPTNPAIGEEVYLYSASPIAGYQRQRWDGSAWSILSDSRWQGTSASNFLTASSTTTAGYTGQSSITYTPASITLTPGIWLVRSMMSLINASTTDTAAVGIWNQTTSAFVSGSYGPSSYTTTSFGVSISSMMTRITVSSNTQVCPYGNRNGGSTISVFGGVGAPSGAITATRLFYS
jgi:microcystin-dependent protein